MGKSAPGSWLPFISYFWALNFIYIDAYSNGPLSEMIRCTYLFCIKSKIAQNIKENFSYKVKVNGVGLLPNSVGPRSGAAASVAGAAQPASDRCCKTSFLQASVRTNGRLQFSQIENGAKKTQVHGHCPLQDEPWLTPDLADVSFATNRPSGNVPIATWSGSAATGTRRSTGPTSIANRLGSPGIQRPDCTWWPPGTSRPSRSPSISSRWSGVPIPDPTGQSACR